MSSHSSDERGDNAIKIVKEERNIKIPRQKRLKVNRACYTCRVKKIKVTWSGTHHAELVTDIATVVRWITALYAGERIAVT